MLRFALPRAIRAGLFLALIPVAVLAADAPAKTPIIAADLLKLKQLEAPALSPDGKLVVYVVRSIEPKPDAKDDWVYHTHLWLAPVDGSQPPRRLTYGASNNTAPQWHPDGQRIAFVRGQPGERPQIHVLALNGGEAQPITRLETGATNPRWSPDGQQLLFSSSLSYAQVRAALEKAGHDAKPRWNGERPGRPANDTRNFTPARKGGAATAAGEPAAVGLAKADGSLADIREWLAKNEADANPRVTARYNFLAEGDLQADLTFTQLYLQDAKPDAEAKPLDLGYESKGDAEWLPDGRRLVFVAPRDAQKHPDRLRAENALFLLDVATGARTALTTDDANYNNPAPSPDGQWIACNFTEGGAFSFDQSKVALLPLGAGERIVLTPQLDRQATAPKWSPDSSAVYFTAPSVGRFPLYRVPLNGRDVQKLTWQSDWGIRDFDVGPDGLVQIVTHPGNPSELHAASSAAKISRPLTTHNSSWIEQKQLAVFEEHSIAAANGMPLQYWTMKPTNFDPAKKYPLILNIHGGPSAMWGPGEESMWFEFQFYAARGYAQVFGNPRGSGGYGRDFQRANYRDWGFGPASDVLSFATEAAKQPFVDPERQVITGGSYGGYLTAFVITQDHRFKAAVAQRGVYDLITFFGEGNAWFLVPLYFGGYPWEPEVRAALIKDSPYTYADQIKTPLLIKHGDVDYRTGVIQSQMLYKTLKALGRDTEYVRYPRATHELSRSGEPKQRLDRLVRYEEFFRRYVGGN